MATPGAADSRAGSPTVPATGGWDFADQTGRFHGDFTDFSWEFHRELYNG